MKGFKTMLAGMALLIGAIAVLRSDWIVAAYWIAVEIYWGLTSITDGEGVEHEG